MVSPLSCSGGTKDGRGVDSFRGDGAKLLSSCAWCYACRGDLPLAAASRARLAAAAAAGECAHAAHSLTLLLLAPSKPAACAEVGEGG